MIVLLALDAYVLLEVYDAVRKKNRELDLQLNMEPAIGPQTAIPRKTKLEKRQERVLEKSRGASKNNEDVKVILHISCKFIFSVKIKPEDVDIIVFSVESDSE